MDKKKHKLYFISPSGKELELGFLSPCKEGFVLGVRQVEGAATSHLTVLTKKGTISAHITPQDTKEKRTYFHPMTKREIAEKIQFLIGENFVSQVPARQLSQEVLYITQRVSDWFDTLFHAFYEERVSTKEVIHILNFKRLAKTLPTLIQELKESPYSFLGLCKASDILHDISKIAGITTSGLLIIPIESRLYKIDLSLISNFSFTPTLQRQEISSPLVELGHAIGIPQYVEEIEKKKFLEKLFSENKNEDKSR